MLYLSTRNRNDTQTAHKAIHNAFCADGGLFVPFRMPEYSAEEIAALGCKSFSQNMADILNLFFSAGLSGWDVEFLIGRNCVKLTSMSHRILVGELWHNTNWNFDYLVQTLSDRMKKSDVGSAPTPWVQIAVRIAAVFGLYGILLADHIIEDNEKIDVAVPTGDFSAPMAVWYARKMGLPVGNIICGCNENGAFWDLVNLGELPTGNTVISTTTPLCDMAVPAGIERLVFDRLSQDEARRFAETMEKGRTYFPPEEAEISWNDGMFAAVISAARVASVIHNVYRNTDQIIGPYDALAYGSLLDYRAKTGQGGIAVLLSERSPVCDDAVVASALRIDIAEFKHRLQTG